MDDFTKDDAEYALDIYHRVTGLSATFEPTGHLNGWHFVAETGETFEYPYDL
jgi:hypothetical protein